TEYAESYQSLLALADCKCKLNIRPEWRRTEHVRMKTEAANRHPLQAVRCVMNLEPAEAKMEPFLSEPGGKRRVAAGRAAGNCRRSAPGIAGRGALRASIWKLYKQR